MFQIGDESREFRFLKQGPRADPRGKNGQQAKRFTLRRQAIACRVSEDRSRRRSDSSVLGGPRSGKSSALRTH